MKPPLKINWLLVEFEIRKVLRDPDFNESEALDAIDAILGWHTARGYEREWQTDNAKFHDYQNRVPLIFDRID